ncbi:uncharacterized protein K460DRAFT_417946 [Cucurbitaria berberidis CBS 394.84]|uniref:F-box domain-containing protein n=1 Tax=Cucurbitaria berberidis CBS 394.84 TaxID=1168544 RepID=A0A9P4GC74_9PLEO|nr:uncharacterized protein K460DRAFT_417946 [Cucurbitaria berberidis CBS 394.84]KAF1842742.1 hypothetical protein K460DRAFT_417946 [Cucurbitaria berberidis CBS 394.84]
MAVILDLPDELLLHIATFLEYDRPALYRIALISRRLRYIAEQLLYRHIEPLYQDEQGKTTGDRRYVLLHRTFNENPHVLKLVWSCEATMLMSKDTKEVYLGGVEYGKRRRPVGRGGQPFPDEEGAISSSSSVSRTSQFLPRDLSCFLNLRELRITAFRRSYIRLHRLETMALSLEPSILQNVSSITLVQRLDVSEVLLFLKLPKIRTLVAHFITSRSPRPDHPNFLGKHQSTLRRLLLCGLQSHGQPETRIPVVTQIMRHCPLLEELRWTPALERRYSNSSDYWTSSDDWTKFSAHPFLECLHLVGDTLTTLELALEDARRLFSMFAHQEGFPVDFAQLRCLKYLKINSFFLTPGFPLWNTSQTLEHDEPRLYDRQRAAYRVQRQNIHRQLPHSIEILHIIFPIHYAMFNNLFDNSFIHEDNNKSHISRDCYKWIFQFALAKKSALENLKHVTLEDEPRYLRSPFPARQNNVLFERELFFIPWQQPEEIKVAFSDAKVRLDVRYGARCDVARASLDFTNRCE